MKEKQLLIIECIPKSDKVNEWLVLHEFLRMSVPESVHAIRISSKNEVINYLNTKKSNLEKFNYVHLSGHGDSDKCTFNTPKGVLTPEDFPQGCFGGKTITLSTCKLGKKSFIEPFIHRTSARYVIAPQREVLFVDAALWFVTFYYNTLHKGMKSELAYERTKGSLERMKGAFYFGGWEQ